MRSNKSKKAPNMQNSIDFYNFCTADNNLPILDIISERFLRHFRISLSNSLRMVTTLEKEAYKCSFNEWKEKDRYACMFLLRLKKLEGPIVMKLDKELSHWMIDVLCGGYKDIRESDLDKEFTQIELALLCDLCEEAFDDLEKAWAPVHNINAEYIRAEVNTEFVGCVPDESRVLVHRHKVHFLGREGHFEIMYPYATLFPVRDQLFSVL